MDAEQLANHIKDKLMSLWDVTAVQQINPQLVTAGNIPANPKAAFQVETFPHQTFIVLVF
jgi:hypothetical protein